MKSITRRQKVTAESDPLSLFLAQSATISSNEDEEDLEEEVVLTSQQPRASALINSLAPQKPIEYEPPTPPPRETIQTAPQVQESVKISMKKEEIPVAPVVAPKQLAPTHPTQPVLKQEKEIIKPPPVPASVFEEEEDIFLKKAVKGGDDDIFGEKDGELSELKFIATKEKTISNKLEDYDSDEEDKLDDLAVGGILEREELDFNMFGKSNIKQYDAPHTTNKSKPATLYQDDFTLETEDEFNQMESILNQTQSSKKYSSLSQTTTKTDSSSSSIDINSFDINAYISQQESDNNVSLFG